MKLTESEARYRRLFETAQDGILILDANTGEITDVNPFLITMLGYSHDEFLGKKLWEIGAFKDIEASRTDFRELQKNGYIRYENLPLQAKDGHRIDVEFVSNTYLVGREPVIQCNIRDITEQTRTENELGRNRNVQAVLNSLLTLALEDLSLDRILKQSLDLILSITWLVLESRGGVFLVEGEPAVLVLKAEKGLSEQILKTCSQISFGECLCGRAAAERKTQFADHIDERHDITYEGIVSHGHYCVPILSSGKALGVIVLYLREGHRYDQQEENFLLAVADSLAGTIQRKRAEEEVKSIARFPSENPFPVLRLNQDGTLLYANEASQALLKDWVGNVGDKVPVFWRSLTTEALATQSKKTIEVQFGEKTYAFMIVPIIGAGYVDLYASDITDRKQHEHELEAIATMSMAMRTAQTLDEMLPNLLGTSLEMMHATLGAIWLYDPASNELRVKETRGWDEVPLDQVLPEKPGEGINGFVFASGQAYVGSNFNQDPRLPGKIRQYIPQGLGGAVFPLRAGENVIGTLNINVFSPRELTPGEVHLMTTLSEIAGSAIQRMRLHEKTQRDVKRFAALHAIDMTISESVDLRSTLNILLEQVVALLTVSAADILLFNPQTLMLEYSAGKGFRSKAIEQSSLRLGEGYAGRAALERRTFNIPDLRMVGSEYARKKLLADEDFIAYYGVPLIAKDKMIGVLDIFNSSPLAPEPEWLDFMEALASQAAIAIDSATLFANLQRSNTELSQAYDATIEGWSRAMDLRDKETEGHTQRVANLTVRLARKTGISEDEIVHIRRGALLHDMGKMGVPDDILLKPGPLTDIEWIEMRRHPQYAYDMLSPIAYLRPALDIPYCHHEKWDGSGYPRGLKGEAIPLAARLFAVVDVWDALTSDRPYRKAWDREKVIEHIKSLSGTHFDPKVVKVFLETI